MYINGQKIIEECNEEEVRIPSENLEPFTALFQKADSDILSVEALKFEEQEKFRFNCGNSNDINININISSFNSCSNTINDIEDCKSDSSTNCNVTLNNNYKNTEILNNDIKKQKTNNDNETSKTPELKLSSNNNQPLATKISPEEQRQRAKNWATKKFGMKFKKH